MTFPKIAGIVGGLSILLPGVWAMAAPESFFEQVARFEPYNQHFVQDIGAFQIGLGVVLLLAALQPSLSALGTALLGTGVGQAAHVVSHVIGRDLGGKPSSDLPMFTVLAVVLLAAGATQLRRPRVA